MTCEEALKEGVRRWGEHGHVVARESLTDYAGKTSISRSIGIHVCKGDSSEYIILASTIGAEWGVVIVAASFVADQKIGEARAIAEARRRYRVAAAMGDFDVPGNA